MKFEKINDNQIRCTLTHSDLIDRELKISELAYGSPKAKALFREMMEIASEELGFEAENVPLMIEAVPISSECIMLIITKVHDPEELDTRFSKFSQPSEDAYDDLDEDEDNDDFKLESQISPEGLGILDLFRKISDEIAAKSAETEEKEEVNEVFDTQEEKREEEEETRLCIFDFETLDLVTDFCHQLPEDTVCSSILYKNPNSGHFMLVLTSDDTSEDDYKEVCALATEFANGIKGNINTLFYFDEHYELFIRKNALQILKHL